MRIGKKELNQKYGISLNSGKYRITVKNGNYEINNVKDDTEGCILVGEYLHDGFITKSRDTFLALMRRINAVRAKEVITIEII